MKWSLIVLGLIFSGCYTYQTGPVYKPVKNKVEPGSAKIGATGGLGSFPFSIVYKEKKYGRESITSRNFQITSIKQNYMSVDTGGVSIAVLPIASSKKYESYFSFKMKDPDQVEWKISCYESLETGGRPLESKQEPDYERLGMSCSLKSKEKGKWKLSLYGGKPHNVHGTLRNPDKVEWEVEPVISSSFKGPAGFVIKRGNMIGGKVMVTGSGGAWLTSNKKDQPGFFAASVALYLRQLAY